VQLKDIKVGSRAVLKDGTEFQVISQLGELTMIDCSKGRWSVSSEQEVFNKKESTMAEQEKSKRSGQRADIIKAGMAAGKSAEVIIKEVQKVLPEVTTTQIRMQMSAIRHYQKNQEGKPAKKAKEEKAPKAKKEKSAKPAKVEKPKKEKKTAPEAPAGPEALAKPVKAKKEKKEKKEKKDKTEKSAPAAEVSAPAVVASAPAPAAGGEEDLF
jgi:hypothetical protein